MLKIRIICSIYFSSKPDQVLNHLAKQYEKSDSARKYVISNFDYHLEINC